MHPSFWESVTSRAFSRPSASPAPLNTCLAHDVPELVSSLLCSPPWTVLGQTCHFHGPWWNLPVSASCFICWERQPTKMQERTEMLPREPRKKISLRQATVSFRLRVCWRGGGRGPWVLPVPVFLPKCLSLSSLPSQFFPQKGSSLLGSPLTLCVYMPF